MVDIVKIETVTVVERCIRVRGRCVKIGHPWLSPVTANKRVVGS
jgi:hypothetical protein